MLRRIGYRWRAILSLLDPLLQALAEVWRGAGAPRSKPSGLRSSSTSGCSGGARQSSLGYAAT